MAHCKKKPYDTKEEAEEAMWYYRRKYHHVVTAYKCGRCGKWHLGRQRTWYHNYMQELIDKVVGRREV